MNIKHGMRFTPEYRAWTLMKSRCLNEKDIAYARYGGRGIRVCDSWKESFVNFYKDMGSKPTPKHSLDRIDNNGNYDSENCRWANQSVQMHNRRGFGNTKVLGIHKTRGGYQALITKNLKRYFLGTYQTLTEAVNAYKAKEVELYG